MTRYLLDVNALLALIDPAHIHHASIHEWYSKHSPMCLVLCSLTANGVMRIASQPKYPNAFATTSRARAALQLFAQAVGAEFCEKDVSLLDDRILLRPEALIPASVTDLYLLALAVANEAKFATFDRRIPAQAVAGGIQALEIIPVVPD